VNEQRAISLTPGFSPVIADGKCQNRFNGFPRAEKPLKRLDDPAAVLARLKPGVNERDYFVVHRQFVE
jgi:hypothetical protein